MRVKFFIALAMYLLVSVMSGTSYATLQIDLGDGRSMTFGGYLGVLGGLRTSGEHQGKCDALRTTFQPEFFVQFTDDAKLIVSGQFVKEISYEMEEDANLSNDYYDQTDFEAYELYLDLDLTRNLHMRTGRQFVVWGETDIFRLLDIVNPQDSSWISPGVMPLEDTRIPNWMLSISNKFGFNSSLELVYVPMLDDDDQRVGKGAPTGGRWKANPAPSANAFNNLPSMAADYAAAFAAGATLDMSNFAIAQVPEKELDEGRVGARFRMLTDGGVDLAFVAWWGHDYSPVLEYKGGSTETRRELVDDGTGNAVWQDIDYFVPHVNAEYHRQATFGFSFNYYDDVFSKAVWRGEFAYLPDKHYNTIDPDEESGVVEKDLFQYALGYDKELVWGLLHPDDPSTTFFLSIQMFQKIIFDHDDDLRLAIYDPELQQVDTTFTALINTTYCNAAWKPELVGVYNTEGNGLLRARLTYFPPWNNNYYAELTYVNYMGNDKYEGMGLFNRKDSVFLRLRYMW